MNAQGYFDSLLGYSLKRDYLGEGLNWRNIETFNLEIQITDLSNMSVTAADGHNHLSAYMLQEVVSKLKVDKRNTTIKSVELASSESGTDNLVGTQKYVVVAEVNSKIDNATLLAQHPELNEATGAEDGKFYGIKDAIHDYTDQIVSISETLSFDEKENGNREFSHNVELSLRQMDYCSECENNKWSSDPLNFADEIACRTHYGCPDKTTSQSTKSAAANIAGAIFSDDVNNTYFGHNVFSGALQNYGLTGATANKHYFTESFDTIKNTYSFVKKMTILKDSETAYTTNKKYSIEISKEGRISVSETMDLKSRNGNWDDLKAALPALKVGAHGRCNATYASYSNDSLFDNHAGGGGAPPLLYSTPLTQTVIHDKQGLTMTLSSQYSSDVQGGIGGGAEVASYQFLRTLDLTRDHRGVITATRNVTLTSHRPKSTSAENDLWVSAYCSDSTQLNKVDCKNANATWTPGKTALDVLKDYDETGNQEVYDALQYGFPNVGGIMPFGEVGAFWNVLNYVWPAGATSFGGGINVSAGPSIWPVSTAVSSSSMGKAYTLTTTYSTDVMLNTHNLTMMPGTNRMSQLHRYCEDCFTKTEAKWNDVWPKKVVSEHVIINRGTSNLTKNRPGTSVLSDAYHTLPGKRSVTLSCQARRSNGSLIAGLGSLPVEPLKYLPITALKAMAAECKDILLEVFRDPKVSNSYQYAWYISNLTYSYNSDNKLSMTAELTYTYKKPPPPQALQPAP